MAAAPTPPSAGPLRACAALALLLGLALALTAPAAAAKGGGGGGDTFRARYRGGGLSASFQLPSEEECVNKRIYIGIGESVVRYSGDTSSSGGIYPRLQAPLISVDEPLPAPSGPVSGPRAQLFFSYNEETYCESGFSYVSRSASPDAADTKSMGLTTFRIPPSAGSITAAGTVSMSACGRPAKCNWYTGEDCERDDCVDVTMVFKVDSKCDSVFSGRSSSSYVYPDGSSFSSSGSGKTCVSGFDAAAAIAIYLNGQRVVPTQSYGQYNYNNDGWTTRASPNPAPYDPYPYGTDPVTTGAASGGGRRMLGARPSADAEAEPEVMAS
ncbi:hypothetical protein HYH03_004515 [Edaphochlamys debaryana]|uniref:Uncharacterized protein n=1 Tax=Edaphochlamys debaryana TaxID=47281 RepID=A0A835Y794_9CHLO|nr:hypothetical protein HYH03_004515 [Edaphochlamys debaryana]|eukprot:KAG2497356.1 hypothetical protein HYH03_004515 [Edaphochlamys debaryana]